MGLPAEQAETAALLRGLAGHDPVETHISAVFVGEDTVWKLRKAVRLSFLDFSTLAERRRTALRELELNAPFAPGLYQDVVPVTREPDGTLVLDGDGEPVDWVLRMAHVPQTDFLDAMAEADGLTPALLDDLADAVAAMHEALPAAARDDPAGALRTVAIGNGQSARGAGLDERLVQGWLDAMLPALAAQAGALERRRDQGMVRRAHGDLHLGNLCLWPDASGSRRPVPFDALEFDEDLATVDVAYDLAFLLMDLEHAAGRASANRVLNRYLARRHDPGLVAVLPAFLSLRAMVRAHVEASRSRPEPSRRYLAQARAALEPAPAVVIGIGGLPGTGKSTLARLLAPALGRAPGALVLRSDEIRKRREGVAPETRLGPAAYTGANTRAVMRDLVDGVGQAARGGHCVIADTTFLDGRDRAAVAAAAGNVPFVGLWLEAPLATLEVRVAARTGDASDADVEILRRMAATDPGRIAWTRIDVTDLTAAPDAAREALRAARLPC